jgi:peptide/nickel transport system ATP-binding protein
LKALLEVENLKTHFSTDGGTVAAVDGVSFHISKGETFCLVGESGSGKSVTALSVIQLMPAGISSHPDGSILFDYRHHDGRIERVDILTLPEHRKREIRGARISMIFQEPMTSLNPVFTIGDQIIESLNLHRPNMSESQARARAIQLLEQVRIPNAVERMDEYPHRLSGGQRQRVMIAIAMACEPDLLIADEPTTALDVTVQAEILRLMKDLQARRGTSILFITHDFGVVSQMADRLAVMRLGKIVETGTLSQVLRNPQHEYTRQLLAALPENLKKSRTARIATRDAQADRASTIAPSHALLELSDLQVHFPIRKGVVRRTVGYVKAVDGVSMQIPAGQILALVGESGCGKSTLGRAILRLIQPTGGRIDFAGQDMTTLSRGGLKPLRRRMQIVFQDPISSLNPRLTVAATLTEPMAAHGIGESREERVEMAREILRRVQLDPEYLWRYPHEFSGGQRQRICIARALVLDPQLMICDEVTSALDVSVQAEILQMLLALRRERHLTILFITHDIGVVEYISDEVAVMYEGRIVERGLTEQVCSAPRHPYTTKLLAAVLRVGI